MLKCPFTTPIPATTSDTTIKWLASEDKKMDTGTISAGNTVLVIRFALSTIEFAERVTVSWNNHQGRNPQNSHSA